MMRRHSPYNYAFNNPVYFIDPDGMMPYMEYNPVTNTGSVEVYGGFDVTTLDGEKNIISSEYHSNINDAMAAAGEIAGNIFNEQLNTAFGDKVDKPAKPSQENVDQTINKVGTLSDMRESFKEDVKVSYVKHPSSPKLGLTVPSGERWENVANVYIYDAAFVSYRTLAQTLFHEFFHVLDFQSLNFYNIFCGLEGRFSKGDALEVTKAISEIRAYRRGHQVTGSSLENNGYNDAIKTLKRYKVDDEF